MNDKVKVSNMTSISLVVWTIGWWFTAGYTYALGYPCIIETGNKILNVIAGAITWPFVLGYAFGGGR